MSLIKFFGFIHIFFIFFCFFATLENLFMNNIIPQFICSTFEKNITIDFDSTMLNSLNKLIYKHFNETPLSYKLTGDIPFKNKSKIENNIYENEFLNYLNSTGKNIFIPNNDEDNKYFIINEGKNIIIIEFSFEPMNDIYSILNKKTIISCYSIPIDNFLINYKEEYDLKKSVINFCWKLNDINGTIIKWEFSLDKKILLILYKQIINGDEIKYKFRYIENLQCNKSNLIINDIDLSGNSQIFYFTVGKNVILYSRVIDLYQIVILIKNEKGDWEKSFYNKINRSEEAFHISTNLIIMKNINCIFHSYITFNRNGVFSKVELIKFLNSYSNYKIINIKTLKVSELNYDKYDMENLKGKNIKKGIKNYMKKTLAITNIKNDFFIYKFLSNIFYVSINNSKNKDLISKLLLYSEEKISSFKGDDNLDNLIINYKNGDMKFISLKYKNIQKYKKEKEQLILLSSIPKRLRKRKILNYYFNKFENNKILMIILYEKGVLACVDFSKIVEVTEFFGFSVNKNVILIIVTCIFSFSVYYFFNRNNIINEQNNFYNNNNEINNENDENINHNNINDVFEGYPLY
jgi:hypothetical protein